MSGYDYRNKRVFGFCPNAASDDAGDQLKQTVYVSYDAAERG